MLRFPLIALLVLSIVSTNSVVRAADGPPSPAPAAVAKAPAVAAAPIAPVWQAKLSTFDDYAYEQKVEALIATFEQSTGKKLVPGEKKKVGLKVYTDSGAGMATPLPLVRGVIRALVKRGFANTDIFFSSALNQRSICA